MPGKRRSLSGIPCQNSFDSILKPPLGFSVNGKFWVNVHIKIYPPPRPARKTVVALGFFLEPTSLGMFASVSTS